MTAPDIYHELPTTGDVAGLETATNAADSKALSAGLVGSTADSKALSVVGVSSAANSKADSVAVVGQDIRASAFLMMGS